MYARFDRCSLGPKCTLFEWTLLPYIFLSAEIFPIDLHWTKSACFKKYKALLKVTTTQAFIGSRTDCTVLDWTRNWLPYIMIYRCCFLSTSDCNPAALNHWVRPTTSSRSFLKMTSTRSLTPSPKSLLMDSRPVVSESVLKLWLAPPSWSASRICPPYHIQSLACMPPK